MQVGLLREVPSMAFCNIESCGIGKCKSRGKYARLRLPFAVLSRWHSPLRRLRSMVA